MTERLWASYDEMGVAYRDHAEHSAYNAHYDRPAVLAELGDVGGRRVLDAACGPGIYAERLLRAGAEVVGFDASETMLALANERTAGRIRLDRARLGEPLPYPDEDFDLAVCALAIHYVEDRRAALAELHRVLRPGGALVLSTQHPVVDWLRKGGSYFDTVLETDTWRLATGDRKVRFWRESLSALCDAATGAGFVIERLVEPRPVATMAERFPEEYALLSREPGFLVLRLRKRAGARPVVSDPVAHDPAADLLEAVRRRSDAMCAADADALRARLHPRFRWTSHRGDVLDRDAYVRSNTGGDVVWRSQTLLDPVVTVIGETAVVAGLVVDQVERDGPAVTLRMPVTQTWVRVDGRWLCLGGHAGPLADEGAGRADGR